jgi:hypothetical protein
MTQKTGLVDNKLDDEGVRFTDVTNMPEKRGKAETPTIVQREHVHKAIAGQEVADQDGGNDHAAAVSRDRGNGAAKFPDEGIQERPKKPPDAGCIKLKRVGPGMMKTGILLIHLLLMLDPMIMISGPVLMNIYVGDGELHASEKEFVYTEGNIMDGGGNVAVPVNDSGGTAPIKADGGIDVQDLFAEGGDVHTRLHLDDEGAVPVRVPVDDSGGAAPVLSDDRGDT